jgi:hypothetical protein
MTPLRLLLAIALASAATAASAAPPPPPPDRTFDWCSSVVVRPDQRRREEGSRCVAEWPDEKVAAAAEVVLVGAQNDVDRDNAATVPPTRCAFGETHRARRRYVDTLRAKRAEAGGAPLRVIHMTRFDLVSAPFAAEPGFRADFLTTTDRPFRFVLDFFAADRSPLCGAGGCRWSHAIGAWEDRFEGAWLRDSIDASGGPKRHESVVYYLVRANQVRDRFWPTAAIADLRNPAYRAWRVALAKRSIEIGGYDAVLLNEKFHMYREPYWIGSEAAPDVAALRARGDDTLWSAPPRDYTAKEYLEGWSALARDLRAAGVPYALLGFPAGPWNHLRGEGGDEAAADDQVVKQVASGARLVMLPRKAYRGPARASEWAADFRARGVEVHWFDTACGMKSSR